MSKSTSIQWCDGTVNPFMGCDGCPLFPPVGQVINELAGIVGEFGIPADQAKLGVQEVFGGFSLTEIYHRRKELGRLVTMPLPLELGKRQSGMARSLARFR